MGKKDKTGTDTGLGGPQTAPGRLTPIDIQQKEFRVSRFGGYKMRDVDEFLDQITDAFTSLTSEIERLRAGGQRRRSSARPISTTSPVRPTRSSRELAPRRRGSPRRPARAPAPSDRRAAKAEHRTGPAVNEFIARERAFLQSLAGLVQEHAETVKGMAKSSRPAKAQPVGARARPSAAPEPHRRRPSAAGRARAAAAERERSPNPQQAVPGGTGSRSRRSAGGDGGRDTEPRVATTSRPCGSRNRRTPRRREATPSPRETARSATCSGERTDRNRPPAVRARRRRPLPRGARARCVLSRPARRRAADRGRHHARRPRGRCGRAGLGGARRRFPQASAGAAKPARRTLIRTGSPSIVASDAGPSTSPWITSTARVSPATTSRWLEQGVGDDRPGLDAELDAVGDLERRAAARLLHGADQLARHPFAPEIVGEVQVERERDAPVAGDTPALPDVLRQVDVVGIERRPRLRDVATVTDAPRASQRRRACRRRPRGSRPPPSRAVRAPGPAP